MKTILLACVLAAAAAAQDKELAATFARWDANGDKIVERPEYPGSDEQFATMDPNKDGKVTLAEFEGSPVARRIVAARERNKGEARERVSSEALAERRLAAVLERFDRNGDGRIPREEWTGGVSAFDTLDLDRNGVLDARDKTAAARAAAPDEPPPAAAIKSELPEPEVLLKNLDTDKDARVSKREVAGTKLEPHFATADTNRDGFVDLEELRRVVGAVRAVLAERNRGYEKPRAENVPFSGWDKNGDGRLDTNEFVEMKDLFPRLDLDRDGYVTKVEYERYKRQVEGENFVERFDLNGDGAVTAEEFGGPIDAFRRADRNGDGVVTNADR